MKVEAQAEDRWVGGARGPGSGQVGGWCQKPRLRTGGCVVLAMDGGAGEQTASKTLSHRGHLGFLGSGPAAPEAT